MFRCLVLKNLQFNFKEINQRSRFQIDVFNKFIGDIFITNLDSVDAGRRGNLSFTFYPNALTPHICKIFLNEYFWLISLITTALVKTGG